MAVVFLDTSYLLALEIGNDQNHRLAAQHWRGVTKSLPQLVTTSFVLDEV
jgi:predicted nucleic acid-binding protein